MVKKLRDIDWSGVGDDKALAIAAYGESVAAYRYIVLSEKARSMKLHEAFEAMAGEERGHRDRIQKTLQRLSPSGGYYLTARDKTMVCVGPRLLDARDDARFDEAMKLVIGSEKRTSSFFARYADMARDGEVRSLFMELAAEGIHHVQRLREIFRDAGKQISEPCPVQEIKP